jgi:hypothetical protein
VPAVRRTRGGAGIEVFTIDAKALGGKIVPLDVERHRPPDSSCRPGGRQISRARRMIDWLVEVFNSTKYPWFKHEFVQPGEFKTV